jgi:tRNA-dihydrouridine synthase B
LPRDFLEIFLVSVILIKISTKSGIYRMSTNNHYWQGTIAIGPYAFPRFIASPLDGVINAPYRQVIRLFSPQALLYSEIRHVASIMHTQPEQWRPLANEYPLNFQLTAENDELIEAVCERVLTQGIKMVDINIGCPARNIIRQGSGAGSALMGDLPRLKKVITAFRKHLPVPLTVKMRAGFKEPNALEVVQFLADTGIDAICIHPRLQPQGHAGFLDFDLVANIKKMVAMPVMISGGITSFAIAKEVYEKTGVDGFLVGRALIGKPWLLKQLYEESQGKIYMISPHEIQEAVIKHIDYGVAWRGTRGLAYVKKHLATYLKGLQYTRTERQQLLISRDAEELKDMIRKTFVAKQV